MRQVRRATLGAPLLFLLICSPLGLCIACAGPAAAAPASAGAPAQATAPAATGTPAQSANPTTPAATAPAATGTPAKVVSKIILENAETLETVKAL